MRDNFENLKAKSDLNRVLKRQSDVAEDFSQIN